MNLEQALESIREDELLEITPKSIRLRKKAIGGAAASRRRSGYPPSVNDRCTAHRSIPCRPAPDLNYVWFLPKIVVALLDRE